MADNNKDTTNSNEDSNVNGNKKSGRGFSSMDEDKQREIASKGGKAAHERGTAHEFTSDEARIAGQKGGKARQGNKEAEDASSLTDSDNLSSLDTNTM